MKPVDPRLLRHARAVRGYMMAAVVLGVVVTGMVVAQAELLARLLASAARGTSPAVLSSALIALLAVVAVRAAAAYGGEVAALRAAAAVKSQLRTTLAACLQRLGPAWLGRQQPGEITTVATRGLDGLDPYFARYLPQLILACLVPTAVLATVAAADWISAVIIAVTLPLIPVFAVLVGLHTRARTQRQWQLLARLGGHFLDVVEGLPTLKVFGRAKAQADAIKDVTADYRSATMATLRVAFLSALVLELAAALATALVAVEVGLRLLAGHLGYQTALLVLLLTPEAYLPLRAVGLHFHASMEGAAAAGRVCDIIETAPASPSGAESSVRGAARGAGGPTTPGLQCDLRYDEIILDTVSLAYPGRDRPALAEVSLRIRPGDRVAVMGPNGAGKSSLLSLLLRFTEPTGGLITAGGVDVARIDMETGGGRSRGYHSSHTCSPPPWRTISRWASRTPAARTSRGRPGWPERTPSSRRCQKGTTRRSENRRCGCQPGSGSESRWLARSCGTRRCCCLTSPPPISIRSSPGRSWRSFRP